MFLVYFSKHSLIISNKNFISSKNFERRNLKTLKKHYDRALEKNDG